MPFLDDSGIRAEEHQGPVLGAFAVGLDQLERMVALNIAWAALLLPALAGLGFQALPLWLRTGLVACSLLALAPATGVLHFLLARACEGELLCLEMTREAIRQAARPALTRLAPLYTGLAGLALLAWWRPLLLVDVLARLGILLLLVTAIYWGPLFALRPELGAVRTLRESARLVGRYPWSTLRTSLAILAVSVLGVASVGGLFLAAPVLVGLMQMQLYRHLMRTKEWKVSRSRG